MVPNQILFSNYKILFRKLRSSETGVTSAPGGISAYEKMGGGLRKLLTRQCYKASRGKRTGLVGRETCRTWCV
jgi:hypothetical protein